MLTAKEALDHAIAAAEQAETNLGRSDVIFWQRATALSQQAQAWAAIAHEIAMQTAYEEWGGKGEGGDDRKKEVASLKAALATIVGLHEQGHGYLPDIIERMALQARDALGWAEGEDGGEIGLGDVDPSYQARLRYEQELRGGDQ